MARDGKREIRKCRLITGSYDQRLLKVRQASIGTDRADLRAGRGSAKFAGRESEAGKPVKAQRRFKDFDDIWDTMRVIAASLPTQEGRVGDSESYREGAACLAGVAHGHPHSEDQRSMEEVNAVRRNTGITPLLSEREAFRHPDPLPCRRPRPVVGRGDEQL